MAYLTILILSLWLSPSFLEANNIITPQSTTIAWQDFVHSTYQTASKHHKNIETFLSQIDSKNLKILVSIETQKLYLINHNNAVVKTYPISTGLTGTGETAQTGKTPRGLHSIDQKIGHGHHPMQGFKARVPTQMYNPKKPGKDNILGRILVLQGEQSHNSNTKNRCIYIHGTGATWHLGKIPHSRGCIRMHPEDIVELFEKIDEGTPVYIHDPSNPLPWEKKVTLK